MAAKRLLALAATIVTVLTLTLATPALAAAPVALDAAHWIWYPEGDPVQSAPAATRYLRRVFTAPAGPYTDAQLVVTGDDTVDVWLNDTYLGGSARCSTVPLATRSGDAPAGSGVAMSRRHGPTPNEPRSTAAGQPPPARHPGAQRDQRRSTEKGAWPGQVHIRRRLANVTG